MTAAPRLRSIAPPRPERAPGLSVDRADKDADLLATFESAIGAMRATSDRVEVVDVLLREVQRLLGDEASVRCEPSDDRTTEAAPGLRVPIRGARAQLGTLVISGTVAHDRLRSIRLLGDMAGEIASRRLDHARLRSAQRHERNALAIYEAARDFVSISDVGVVLDAIVRRAQEFTGADVAYLALAESDSETFAHRASTGTRTAAFEDVRVGRLQGLTELAARDRQVIVSNDFFQDPRRNNALDRYLRAEGLVSIACAPMYVGDEFVGALFVGNRQPGSWADTDADLLAALGAIAAGAIVNARMHAEARRRLAELTSMNAVVERQNSQLEKWVGSHHRLTRMVLDGQSLPRIAGTIAGLVGNPVAILDAFGKTRAFADPRGRQADSRGTGRRATESRVEGGRVEAWLEAAVQELQGESRPARVRCLKGMPDTDGQVILAAVTTRSGLLGYVAVIEREAPVDEQIQMFVERAANVVAIEFMQERVAAEVETRLRGDLLGELIASRAVDAEELRRRAGLLGHNLAGELRLVLFAASAATDADLQSAVVEVLGRAGPPLAILRSHRTVALLTDSAGSASALRAEELQEQVASRLGSPVSIVAASRVG
ncbi:MAG TPA: GAF domain-containing protein, partial [Candidatus Limnocylindrales bacterium]|nr:GAF domain-containing protein [Candidatus Limnocylindrales bacterium]